MPPALMVVHEIDVDRVASLEAEDDPEIPRDSNGPEAVQVAAEPMQPEAGPVHVFGPFGVVQLVEDALDARDMRLRKSAPIILLVEAPQPAMAEVDDHGLTVRRASIAGDGFEVGHGHARDLEVAGALAGLGKVVVGL